MKRDRADNVAGGSEAGQEPPAVARAEHRLELLLIISAATALIVPMLFLGNASGHDFQFHVASWVDVLHQWHEGIFFPRWAEYSNYGFGSPRFIFYPPLSWLLGAGLGAALPWDLVPGAFIWLVALFAGLAAWRLAGEFLPRGQAAAAAVFFVLNPYQLVVIYYRSDFAELLAAAFFPALFLAALRMMRRADPWRSVPGLAVAFAGIWLSNAPAGVIASYSLALIFAVGAIGGAGGATGEATGREASARRAAARALRLLGPASAAVLLGFGLAAFYILPAAHERSWVQITQVLVPDLKPWRNFLFTQANDPEFLFFNWKISFVACVMLGMAGICAVFAARRRREFPLLWRTALGLGAASVLAMFPVTLPLWRHLPEVQFLQFPWRWLLPLGLVLAIFAAAAPGTVRWKQWAAWVSVAVVIGATGAAILYDSWWDSDDATDIVIAVHEGRGYEGVDEYTPVGCDRYSLPATAPRFERFDAEAGAFAHLGDVRVGLEKWRAEEREFSAESAGGAVLAVQLLDYPAWRITVDGAEVKALTRESYADAENLPALAAGGALRAPPSDAGSACRILIALGAGAHRIDIRFVRTADRTAGGAISLGAVLALLALGVALARRRRGAGARLGAAGGD